METPVPVRAGTGAMPNRSFTVCADGRGLGMDNGSGCGAAWAQLIRDVISSGRLLLGAALLVLVCTPALVALALVLLVGR